MLVSRHFEENQHYYCNAKFCCTKVRAIQTSYPFIYEITVTELTNIFIQVKTFTYITLTLTYFRKFTYITLGITYFRKRLVFLFVFSHIFQFSCFLNTKKKRFSFFFQIFFLQTYLCLNVTKYVRNQNNKSL